MSKRVDKAKQGGNKLDPEVHRRHLKRQLDSLERDNHHSLNDVEGLINIALAAQEEDGIAARSSRQKSGRTSVRSVKTNLSVLLEDSRLDPRLSNKPSYFTCEALPSRYPPRQFCSVCGFSSTYQCLRCGMRYCSVRCLDTHKETRCLKWTA